MVDAVENIMIKWQIHAEGGRVRFSVVIFHPPLFSPLVLDEHLHEPVRMGAVAASK